MSDEMPELSSAVMRLTTHVSELSARVGELERRFVKFELWEAKHLDEHHKNDTEYLMIEQRQNEHITELERVLSTPCVDKTRGALPEKRLSDIEHYVYSPKLDEAGGVVANPFKADAASDYWRSGKWLSEDFKKSLCATCRNSVVFGCRQIDPCTVGGPITKCHAYDNGFVGKEVDAETQKENDAHERAQETLKAAHEQITQSKSYCDSQAPAAKADVEKFAEEVRSLFFQVATELMHLTAAIKEAKR